MGSPSHVDLLRDEHLELQNKYTDLQQKYALLQAKIDPNQIPDTATLPGQVVSTLRNLFENHALSDIVIHVDGQKVKCHKFLLAARSNHWNDLDSRQSINFQGISFKAFDVVYRWMYTDSLPHSRLPTELLQEICQFAFRFHFSSLQTRCVQLLKSRVDVSNCIPLYEFSDAEDIVELRDYCCAIVAAHWNEFEPRQFSVLPATSLFRVLKKNSAYVLHSIVQFNREDVLLLYFIENDSEVHADVNVLDQTGSTPLELALTSGHISMASQLLKKNADCNAVDSCGLSILMRMIEKGDAFACEFLASAGANLAFVNEKNGCNVLHYIASSSSNQAAMAEWAELRLKEMNINEADSCGRTALLVSVIKGNIVMAMILLRHGADVIKADFEEKSPLSVALFERNDIELSAAIVKRGGTCAVNHSIDGETLLHMTVRKGDFKAAQFLIQNGASLDTTNAKEATALEIAVEQNDVKMVALLLEGGASVEAASSSKIPVLHRAISSGPEMLDVFTEKAKNVNWSSSGALRYALDQHLLECAKIIVSAGAEIEELDSMGSTMLVQRILIGDDLGAAFLLAQGANHLAKDSRGRGCFELAALYGLINTLRVICGLGVNINERLNGGFGYSVLELALSRGNYECASLLVSLGCDLESSTADGHFIQTMLHHFIDLDNEKAAIFLVESGCNGDAVRIPRDPNGEKGEAPIHRAVTSRMNALVTSLVKAKVNLSAQDLQGRTACHIAVQERYLDVLSTLLKANDIGFLSLRDKLGQTPFSQALLSKEYTLATAIVKRQPHVALQVNGNGAYLREALEAALQDHSRKALKALLPKIFGENLLHISVKANDLESVLFLLSADTDATRVTSSGSRRGALHYAANVDNELILRNLLLAGCDVNLTAADNSTPLHVAVRNNRPIHTEILLENGANPNIIDERRETALLAAVRCGSVDCVKVLVENRNTDSLAVNKNGQSALHICATLASEKFPPHRSALEMCELLLKREVHWLSEKDFAAYVDLQDADGNTALLLAYMAGNGDICRYLLRFGATMGARNVDGATMFTYETPTRLLLFRLLDSLEREPRWSDGDMCDCGVRFSITVRKHHCRHCGRLVCSKCSEIAMPIAKFGEEKRVRVCSLCAEVLTTGGGR